MKQTNLFLAVAAVLFAPLAHAHEGFHTAFTHMHPLSIAIVVAVFIAVPVIVRVLNKGNRTRSDDD